jgi:hypothetical protein
MKVKDLVSFKVPTLKPRDTTGQAVLAAKRNAGGPMRDKKKEAERGSMKHKGRAYEDMDEMMGAGQARRKLGARVEYDNFKAWFADLPNGASTEIDAATAITVAQGKSKDFEGVCGKFDAKRNSGWIYEHYLKKSNFREGRRHVYGKGDQILIDHPNKTMQKIGKGEEVKVMTKSGVAKITRAQLYNGGVMYKLDRKVKLADGDTSEWVSDREVSLDLDKGAAPSAKAYARNHAMGVMK